MPQTVKVDLIVSDTVSGRIFFETSKLKLKPKKLKPAKNIKLKKNKTVYIINTPHNNSQTLYILIVLMSIGKI